MENTYILRTDLLGSLILESQKRLIDFDYGMVCQKRWFMGQKRATKINYELSNQAT